MGGLLVGPVLVTAALAGVVALLAPCCVSVMLPAYLSTVFRRPAGVIAGTVVFAVGVATVIVPIGLGASALSVALQRWHLYVFAAGGTLMAAGGIAILAGWSPKLPMPGGRASRGGGLGSVYGLGVFSGLASACCAPVLIGVTILAGATGSFLTALAASLAYVAGMVGPLLVMSLGWDRYGGRAIGALQTRRVPLRPGGRHRIGLSALISGLLLAGMGVLTIAIALSGPGMPNGSWQLRLAADLQHAGTVAGDRLSWLPGWAFLTLVLSLAVAITARTKRHRREPNTTVTPHGPPPPPDSIAGRTDTRVRADALTGTPQEGSHDQ
ncbi:MAG: cytochrome C biogenesis protein [Acidimicrobiales bacterium]|nr:MAG: cytochrome C biogenesis protein [Acidimicrobiales bacterium]